MAYRLPITDGRFGDEEGNFEPESPASRIGAHPRFPRLIAACGLDLRAKSVGCLKFQPLAGTVVNAEPIPSEQEKRPLGIDTNRLFA
jgi:hypothetical protein